jgi:hypothetical protein
MTAVVAANAIKEITISFRSMSLASTFGSGFVCATLCKTESQLCADPSLALSQPGRPVALVIGGRAPRLVRLCSSLLPYCDIRGGGCAAASCCAGSAAGVG